MTVMRLLIPPPMASLWKFERKTRFALLLRMKNKFSMGNKNKSNFKITVGCFAFEREKKRSIFSLCNQMSSTHFASIYKSLFRTNNKKISIFRPRTVMHTAVILNRIGNIEEERENKTTKKPEKKKNEISL